MSIELLAKFVSGIMFEYELYLLAFLIRLFGCVTLVG